MSVSRQSKRLRYGFFSVLGFCFAGSVMGGVLAIGLCLLLFYVNPTWLQNDRYVFLSYALSTGAACLGWVTGLMWSLLYEGRHE